MDTLLKNNYFKNSKHYVIPNAIDIDIKELQNIINIRNKNNNKDINFIYVGMLEEKKGILNLLKVFHNISLDNIRLNICGNGNLKDVVLNYTKIDNRIKYLGQLDKIKLKEEWLKSDVLIMPSIWDEPFGRVVIEANQYGLPVLGSNKGGILEIISNIKTGLIFKYDDLNELESKIIYFTDRNNIKKYYNNIEDNISYYSLNKQIKMFEDIYNK